MKVNRPGSPLGAEPPEPLDPRELRGSINAERFAASLAQLEAQAGSQAEGSDSPARSALSDIAKNANLSTGEGAASAVRESARFMVRSRLGEKFREGEQSDGLVEKLSEYVASDPLLKSKLLSILQRLKAA